jgi:cytochrome P450
VVLIQPGQIPWLDYVFRKNPVMAQLTSSTSYVARFALKHLQSRLALPIDSPDSFQKPQARADFLSKFVLAHQQKPEQIPRGHIISWTVSNVNAGSDTTAIALRAIFYYLLKNPASLAKLRAEILAAEQQGALSQIVSWSESQKLPFLDAVIREAMRLHPGVGMVLERVVPKDGGKICGRHFKAGTTVGISAWVVHRDKSVFGEDAAVWRPERWIEADEERRKKMEGRILTFGAGARTCIGKNISRLEMYKFVPQILRDYEVGGLTG